MNKSVDNPTSREKRSKARKVMQAIIYFFAIILLVVLVINFNTIVFGKYNTTVNYGPELQYVTIKIPHLTIKGQVNTVVHPHQHVFYTLHNKSYVEEFFASQVFNGMSKTDYGYESSALGFEIEYFKIYEHSYSILGIIPISKYSFSYQGV